MNLRHLLTFKLMNSSPEEGSREYSGEELIRRRLVDMRAYRWHIRWTSLMIVAMALPISINVSFMVLDSSTRTRDVLLTLYILVLVWVPCLSFPLIWLIAERLYLRPIAKQTRFVPKKFEKPLFRHIWLLLPAVLLFVLFPLWALLTPETLAQDFIDNSVVFETALLMIAGPLIARGAFDRVGEEVECRRCGYPIPPEDVDQPGTCTECGIDLANTSNLALGHTIRRPVSLTFGLAIVAAGVAYRLWL